MSDRRVTRLFLLAVLLHGLVYLCAVAPWMGEDEPWHFEYASHVADGRLPLVALPKGIDISERTRWGVSQLYAHRRFPSVPYEELAARQRAILAALDDDAYFRRVDWAGALPRGEDFDQVERLFTATTQPTGYYLLLGAWLAVWPGGSIDGELLGGRVLSLVLYVLSAWCGLEFARRMFSDRSLALAAALAIAWYPMQARQAAIVNNDVLARTLQALVLMLCARQLAGVGRRAGLALAIAVACVAALVKPTAASAIGVVVVVLLVQAHASGRLRRVAPLALGGAVALGAALWFVLRNNPVVPKSFTALAQRVGHGLSLEAFADLGRTFVGAFNWYSRELPGWVYATAAVVGGLALVSALAALVRKPSGVSRALLVVCFAALGFQLALFVLRGVGSGRYLMPALPAIAALFVVGLLAPLPQRLRPQAAALFAALLVACDAAFLWGGLVPNEWLLWGS